MRLPSAVLTVEEIFALFRFVPHPRDALLLRVLYATGMRQSEVVRFCPADLDFGRGTLMVRPPGQSPDRYLPLDDLTLELLRRWCEGMPLDRPVFPLVPRHVYTRLRLWADALGLTAACLARAERLSVHTLRLSAEAHLRAGGLSEGALQLWLGGELPSGSEWAEEMGAEEGWLPVLVGEPVLPVERFLYWSGVRWSEVPSVVLEEGLVRLPDRVVAVPSGLSVPSSFEGASWRHAAVGRTYGPAAWRHRRAVDLLEAGEGLASLGHREAATGLRYLWCAARRWRAEFLQCHPLGTHSVQTGAVE